MDSVQTRRMSSFETFSGEYKTGWPTNKLPTNKEELESYQIVPTVYKQQLRAPYDSNIVKDMISRSNRYKNLKPTVLEEILGQRRNYGYLKQISISRLEANLKKKFEILSNTTKFTGNEFKPNPELLHNIFSWKWNDFLQRRKLKNFVWVDVLLRMEQKSLHVLKFQNDLEDLQLLLEKVFDGFFLSTGEENADINQNIEKPIYEVKRVLHTTDYIEDELKVNCAELKALWYKKHFFLNAARISEDRLLKAHLEARLFNSHIWDPIEVRYQMKWFQNIVKQRQYFTDRVLERYEEDIAGYKQKVELETSLDGNCMDFCYSSIEVYKSRLVEFQDKFDKELDEMENKLTYLRLQIEKFKNQQKQLMYEIEQFHEAEEQMLIRIEEEERKEKERKEREAKELENVEIRKPIPKKKKR